MKRISFVLLSTLLLLFGILVNLFGDEKLDKLVRKRKYKKALAYAEKVLPPAARSATDWAQVGLSNAKLGYNEKALACYAFAIRLEAENVPALVGMAQAYNAMKQYDKAKEEAGKVMEKDASGNAAWEYAQACLGLDKPAEAKRALEMTCEAQPKNLEAAAALGKLHVTENEHAQAIPLLEKSYKKGKNPETGYFLGIAHTQAKDYGAAESILKKVLKKKKDYPAASLQLARVYFLSSQMGKASSQFDAALSKAKSIPDDDYMNAIAKEQTGKAGAAVEAYRKAIEGYGDGKEPNALTARVKVAKADLKAGQFDAALVNLRFLMEVENVRETEPRIHFLLAEGYEGAGKLDEAIAIIQKLVDLEKESLEALGRLAGLYDKNEMPDKALATYEIMVTLDPKDPNIYRILGFHHLKNGNNEKALDLLERSNNLEKTAGALEGIALAAFALKQPDLAAQTAEEAVAMQSDLLESRRILFTVYLDSEAYAKAAPHLEYTLKSDSANLDYWRKLALCYEKVNDPKNLYRVDGRIIGLDKKEKASRKRFAAYAYENKHLDDAKTVYAELTLLLPKEADPFRKLGNIARTQGNAQEAVAQYDKYAGLKPKDAEVQRDLGDLHYQLKDNTKALSAYDKAAALDPQLAGFYRNYAVLVLATGTQNKKIKVVTRAVELKEAELDMYKKLAAIHTGLKKYNKAIPLLKTATGMAPQDAYLLTDLAKAQEAAAKIDDAITSYEQVLVLNPDVVKQKKALGLLHLKRKNEKRAMELFRAYLEKEDTDSKIASKVGNTAFDNKDYAQAVKYLAMVTGKEAKAFKHLLRNAQALYHTQTYKDAIMIFNALMKRNPGLANRKIILGLSADAYEKTGQNLLAGEAYAAFVKLKGVKDKDASFKSAFLVQDKKPAPARSRYLANTRKFPKDYRNFYYLGLLYAKKKSTRKQAIGVMKKALALNDTSVVIWLSLAQTYGKLGNRKQELATYEQFLAKNPHHVEANKRIGILLVSRRKMKKAIIHLETAHMAQPNDLETIMPLAEAYAKTDRPANSIDLLKKAKGLTKENNNIILQLAKLLAKTGQYDLAAAEMSELVEKTRDLEYLKIFAGILVNANQLEKAEEIIGEVRLSDPENIDILMLQAKLQRTLNRLDEAVETYKEISDIDRAYAPAYFERAEVLVKLEKTMWAEMYYKRALQRDPKFGLAELGLARIEKMKKNMAGYMAHLKKAKKLAPRNKRIQEEWKKAQTAPPPATKPQ